MAKEQQYNTNISEYGGGIDLDSDPINQTKGTTRFVLNAVEETSDGKVNFKSNELGNYSVETFPEGYQPNGDVYLGDDTIGILLVNPILNREEIGILDKANKYTTIVNTAVLGLKVTNQCDITFRLRKGKERVIYWVNGDKLARTFNFDKPQNFYNNTYQNYLNNTGNPAAYLGEKWDASSFDLVKTYDSIPTFNNVQIIETGGALPGSYNFTIQLVDQDLNPTGWITTSNTVNIFNDSVNNSYERIRGSRNLTTDSQSFPRTNKSIQLTIGNLDSSFPYYRVAIIRAAGNTGQPEKVLVSQLYSTHDSKFLYSGNDSDLTETKLTDILIDNEIIYKPQHIEQQENRLDLANGSGKDVNWCDYQKYASKISANLVTTQVVLNDVNSQPNVKDANSTFILRGYMPGEVESFGIAYLHTDGFISPAFHIPGKSSKDISGSNLMKVYQLTDTYLDIHSCNISNYWGVDYMGDTLVGKKIRHHRFPFRKDVNKPLVVSTGTTTNITKHRLKITIILNPAFTPSPSYPNSGTPDFLPLLIDYTFKYQVTGAAGTNNFSGQLTDADMGVGFYIYDDNNTLSFITGSVYSQLDTASELYTIYNPGSNNRFIIAEAYETYTLSSTVNSDVADIFGIKFSNIERPSLDVVGFFIVRNERTDNDKLIVDNAIFGPTTTYQQYISFGLIMPKQYYAVNNCGRTGVSNKTLVYNNKGLWFFNPEFQFFNKKTDFDSIEIEGKYNETTVNMPSISDTANSACNGGSGSSGTDKGGSKGVYMQDVQAGTSYNPDINKKKNKDDDGFDLVLGYRNTNVVYSIENSIVIPAKHRVLFLSSAAYQNLDSKTYYNVSIDNKIGMYTTDSAIDTNLLYNTTDHKNALLYGALVKNNTTAYSNFLTRPYFKEHNNPVLFGSNTIINNFEVYNGDTQISALNFVSSVFYDIVVADRAKKSSIWKIIVGTILVQAAIAATIFTAGGATPAVVAAVSSLAALAISYGVSLAMTGLKFEQFKSMYEVDYDKGLRDTVTDGGVFETVRDSIQRDDDTIRWFTDRVSNIYIESSVPFGLRSGLTTGVSDFVDAPVSYDEAGFRSYLIEKFTTLDREQGSGRLYKGYAGAEVYDMNLDYLRFNKEKEFSHLPIEYDCCATNKESHPLRVWYSEQSFQEENIDNFRVFLPNNYRDIEGETGEITDLYRMGANLFIQTREALWQLPHNNQERVTNEIVSFIGTGEFFSIPPRKILDDALGKGGTKHKWGTIKTANGVLSISEIENKIFLHGQNVEDLCSEKFKLSSYFKENLKSFLSKQLFDKFSIEFLHYNNPANINGTGYLSTYDTKYNRIIITKKDYLLLPELLDILVLVNTIPTSGVLFSYCTLDGQFYDGGTLIQLTNSLYFENKSFTISFSFNNNKWSSWHSYLPNYYINTQNNVYSYIVNNDSVWKHNQEGSYGSFYGIQHSFIIERVGLGNPLQDKIFEHLVLQTSARIFDIIAKQYIDQRYVIFNSMILYNSRQCSGQLIIEAKETQSGQADWYQHQISNVAQIILASRRDKDWYINDFRDCVIDPTKTLFTKDWSVIKNKYYIDKIIDTTNINFNKNWWELESFRDKYIVIRLIFDNFSNNVNLTLNYSLDTEQNTD